MFGDFLRNNHLIKREDYNKIENGTVIVAHMPKTFPLFQFGIYDNGNVIMQAYLIKRNMTIYLSIPFEQFCQGNVSYKIYEYAPQLFSYDKQECVKSARRYIKKYFLGYTSVLGDDFTFICMVGDKFDTFFSGSKMGHHFYYKYNENGLILKHHFISIEQDWVIHFSDGKYNNGTHLRLEDYNDIIHRTTFEIEEEQFKDHNTLVDYLSSRNRAIFEWATMSDFGGYNIVTNNCEHFANYCRQGKRKSKQVKLAFCELAFTVISCIAMKKPIPLLFLQHKYVRGEF